MTTTRAAIAAITLATLVACSSGEDDVSGTMSTAVYSSPSAPVVTTLPEVTSTSTSSTTTIATTSTTVLATTSPPTARPSTAPTETVSPEDQAMAEAVERDWRELKRRFHVALMDPTNSGALADALDYTADGWTDYITGFVGQLRDRNQRILEDPLVEPTLTVESSPAGVAFTSDGVTIITCEIDSWVLVELGSGPGGADTVIDDEVYAYRDEVRLRLVDGIWKTVEERAIERWIGGSCDTPFV